MVASVAAQRPGKGTWMPPRAQLNPPTPLARSYACQILEWAPQVLLIQPLDTTIRHAMACLLGPVFDIAACLMGIETLQQVIVRKADFGFNRGVRIVIVALHALPMQGPFV